jgi:2-keto-4-pentenoate hydratase
VTPLDTNAIAVADAILQARLNRRPCDALALDGLLKTADDAYAVQALVAQGMRQPDTPCPRYWKSGGPSREATLTHAALPAEGVWSSGTDASAWPFNIRLIEVEIALRLGRDVTLGDAERLSHDDAANVVDAMTVSIEVVDSRWEQGVKAPALLKLADLQSHGALILGEWVPFALRDWSRQACTVRIGTAPVAEFIGTHSMGDPAWLLPAWLRHVTRKAETVPAGTVVTTGTWCGMLPASAGDLVVAVFEGVGEAAVRV